MEANNNCNRDSFRWNRQGKSAYSLPNKLLVRNAIQHDYITLSKGLVVAENKGSRNILLGGLCIVLMGKMRV